MNDEAALPGRPAQQVSPDAATIARAPELHLVLAIEQPVEVRIYAYSFGDEIRLLDDLDSRRPRLFDEIRDALEDALEAMRIRRVRALPGDLAA